MQQMADWLKRLGMARYAQAFAANGIDIGVLPSLTDQALEKLGVSLGHRRKMLRAIRDLGKAPVPATTRQDGAERRQLTVMFCELAGSMALATKLDPEDLRSVIGAYHKCVAETVARFDGFVARYMGDGVLAYFGYPRAHEHDAERAVRAGLGLVEAVAKLGTHAGSPLQVRVGIATGLVVVGDLIGAGAAQGRAVVGETPKLAVRLPTLADSGAVVISMSTHRLTGGLFEYRSLGSVALEGFGDNVPAWQVLGTSAAESRFQALRVTKTPLLGRDDEIGLLMRRWQQAKRGDGSVVLISGEPGIGKSRIAETVVERSTGEPHTRLRRFCSPHHQNSALYPIISQLERAAGFRRGDTDQQRLDKLEALLAEATGDLGEAAPLIADLLSVPVGARYPPLSLAPQRRKERTLRALLAQFEGLAARQPVLMVFEDAHWIDPTSLELLDLTIERVPTLAVLLIITFRPEFAPRWVDRPQVTLLSLSRLPPRQRAEMITRVTGGKMLPKDITDQIIDRTDGVPLFIEELTKAVVESGTLIDAGDHFAMTGPMPRLAIPTSLHASLLARLDRLAPSAREVAQIGAVLGRQFSHELIGAVAHMPRHILDEALVELMSAELVFRRGTPPYAEYTFKHALVQDVAYNTLLRNQRQQLHGCIAATLEGQFAEIVASQPELLARHCTEARLTEKGVGYRLKAGRLAITRCAMTEAVAQLRKGLDLLSGASDGAACEEQELDLQIALGEALMATRGQAAPESGAAFGRARQLAEQLDRPSQLVRVLVGQFRFRHVRGELEQAKHYAEEIRHLGEALNDVMWRCFGLSYSGTTRFFLGKFIDARAYQENALSLWDPAFREFAATPEDPYVPILLWLSRTLLCLGYIEQARMRLDEALAEARQRSPYTLTWALCHAWPSDWAMKGAKSATTTLQSAEKVLTISSEHSFSHGLAIGNIMRGWALGAVGHPLEGIPLLLRGLTMRRAAGAKVLTSFFLTTLAEVYGKATQPKEGLNRLSEAIELLDTTRERWAEAELHRLRGTLLESMRQPIGAEESYRSALAVARRQSAKFWELRAALDLARLWNDQGKYTEARDLLGPVYNWFTEGLDTSVLQDAKALLDQLT
jgi:class 3 adenylate cyclase/tetratricopeptide (TPR) repeat protein